MMVEGLRPWRHASTATIPVSLAARSRRGSTAGMTALPGIDIPRASQALAIVLAVPMMSQVP